MNFVDELELKLELNNPEIDFEALISDVLSDKYEAEDIEKEVNELGGIRGIFEDLNNRFIHIGLDIFTPSNGYATLDVSINFQNKKNLHRFLIHKSITGGENASTDGSAVLFEEISANSVCSFLGENSKKIMVGEGRQRLTEDQLKIISQTLKERAGVFDNLPARAQDDGVDFIVYKPLDIREVGNMIILGQACVGKHYKTKKSIFPRWQGEYINFQIKPPTTLLSIVHYLDSAELKSVQSQFSNSLVFDRARILKYYDSSDVELNQKITDFISNI